jgi:hypothetical protein
MFKIFLMIFLIVLFYEFVSKNRLKTAITRIAFENLCLYQGVLS